MATLERDGVEIHYEVYGEGPALLLTHGFSATSGMWDGQIDALSQRHTLITWDMRGHGESASPADAAAYSEAHTVVDMAAILDAAGFDRAIIGGLSLGGYMSLAFNLEYRQRVRALLIIDTGPGYRNAEAREGWNANAMTRADEIERLGEKALQGGSAERSTSVHRDTMGVARAARGMLTQRDSSVIDSLPDIDVPTLVIAGADDQPFLVATDYMARKIPGAKKRIIPEAGHAVNIDQRDAFNAAVSAFLQALDAPAEMDDRDTSG